MDGVAGGQLAGMVKSSGVDQSDDAPLLSVAITFIWYVSADVHLWYALAPLPGLNSHVAVCLPSPQSNVYFTRSPSASFAEVEKL